MVLPDEVRQTVTSYLAHQSRKEVSAIAEVIERERRRLVDVLAEVSQEQAEFVPSPGQWSIRDVVEHVAAAERGVVEIIAPPGRRRRTPGRAVSRRPIPDGTTPASHRRAGAALEFGRTAPSRRQPGRQARPPLLRAAELEGVAGLSAGARRGPHRADRGHRGLTFLFEGVARPRRRVATGAGSAIIGCGAGQGALASCPARAEVAESVDATVSKTVGGQPPCRFESGLRHQRWAWSGGWEGRPPAHFVAPEGGLGAG